MEKGPVTVNHLASSSKPSHGASLFGFRMPILVRIRQTISVFRTTLKLAIRRLRSQNSLINDGILYVYLRRKREHCQIPVYSSKIDTARSTYPHFF